MPYSYTISPVQSKAARTYLDWTQEDLGRAAGLDRSTVRSFEAGYSPRRNSVLKIRKALEAQGIEFLEDDGVKRRGNDVKVYRGFDSCNAFYDDLLQTINEQGGDVYCVLSNQNALSRILGGTEKLAELSRQTTIKCLVSEDATAKSVDANIQCRLTAKGLIRPDFFISYGDKYVNAFEDSSGDFLFVVFQIAHVARGYRLQFLSMWADALPLSDNRALRSLSAVSQAARA